MSLNFAQIILIFAIFISCEGFEHPPVTIKVYSPKGFSVSIPALPDITLFAFHGKLNEELNGLEAGFWSRDITKARNGTFTFFDRDAELKIGDTIYFWTYALHNGLGYRHDNGEFVIKNYDSGSLDDIFPSKSRYEVPTPQIKIFHPKGFQVSIPKAPGMTLFAFHGRLNEEFVGVEAGTWSQDITNDQNGSFIFKDSETALKVGDKLHYWLFVIKDGLGYRRDNGVYTVEPSDFFDERSFE